MSERGENPLGRISRFQSKADLLWVSRGLREVERRIRWTAGLDSCTTYEQNCGDACEEHEPGMEIPVQAEKRSLVGKSARQSEDVMWIKVAKRVSHVPRKAAIVSCVPVP